MAEATKQFFVGFIHPRTWLAALLGIVVAVLAAVVLSSGFTAGANVVGDVAQKFFSGDPAAATAFLKALGTSVFDNMLRPYTLLTLMNVYSPIVILAVGGFVGGLIFGLSSKKERVASKSIVGGLNIATIYLLLVVVAYVFWTIGFSGFQSFGAAAWSFLSGIAMDILLSFIIVWSVSALIAILILSLKGEPM